MERMHIYVKSSKIGKEIATTDAEGDLIDNQYALNTVPSSAVLWYSARADIFIYIDAQKMSCFVVFSLNTCDLRE